MKKSMAVLGWTLRACSLICVTWIVAQVFGGKITALPVLLSSVLWHAAFALSGVALVGASHAPKRDTAEADTVGRGVADRAS